MEIEYKLHTNVFVMAFLNMQSDILVCDNLFPLMKTVLDRSLIIKLVTFIYDE